MPKERLNNVRHPGDVPEGEWMTPAFSLNWVNREDDGWAQLSVEVTRAQLEAVLESEDMSPEESKSDTITLYSDPLSRYEMNRDVVALRKARNQVHGADE